MTVLPPTNLYSARRLAPARLPRRAALATLLLLSGCATSKPLPAYSVTKNKTSIERAEARLDAADSPGRDDSGNATGAGAEAIGADDTARQSQSLIPTLSTPERDAVAGESAGPGLGEEDVDAVIAPLPLPAFIDVAFGKMLGVPYVTGAGVAARTEIVQLRSSGRMPPEAFLDLVSTALQNYGVRVVAENGAYQIVEDSALKARLPRFIRSRSRAETPANLRPIVQFVELNAIRASDMDAILRQAFNPREESLKIEAVDRSNYLILSGLPDDVNAALTIISQMDELQYAGTQVERYAPVYWEAANLTQELLNILTAEGWQASGSSSSPLPILLLSVPYSNDLLIFTRTPQARLRTRFWISELDRPTKPTDGGQLFVYNVKYLDAALLAATANQAVSSGRGQIAGTGAPQAAPNAASPGAGGAPSSSAFGSFIVDPYGNRLIFSGTPSEYNRILPLLETLDKPAPEVLIEVMIAQITLTDGLQSGVEWVINNVGGNTVGQDSGLDGIIQQSGLGLGTAGLVFSIFPDNAQVNLNAFAENSQVDVLSTPRLVARSGGAAQVQVGTEVPILSAQRLPVGGAGGQTNLDVISSVEYRSTGIILQIEPIVFSDRRIDLNITQEVSAALPSGGPIASPTFSNTNVTTQLSLEDGATAVIGGLIQDNVTRSESGIPFLKDIPLLGNAFSARSTSVDRSELVILITAYILRDKDDKGALAAQMSRDIDRTLNADNLITLRARHFK